jgi:hypothetical protein
MKYRVYFRRNDDVVVGAAMAGASSSRDAAGDPEVSIDAK